MPKFQDPLQILDVIPFACYMPDDNANFIHINDKTLSFLKMIREEILGENVKVMEAGSPITGEYLVCRFIDAQGETHWISTKNDVYIRNEEGASPHIIGILQGILKYRELEKKNRQLTNERWALEKQQQKEILKATLNAQEQERQRIAESVHNGLGQMLYGVKATLERLKLEDDDAMEENIHILDKSKELLEMCIQESRKISHELMPSILEDFGLKASITDICNQLKGKTHFNCTFSEVDVPIDKYLQLAIYRIVQELALNISKHAEASKAHINISIIDGQIHIMAKDNGKGFNNTKSAEHKEKGIGLKTIESKVKLLNGKIDITSQPHQTIVKIQFPL